MIMKTLKATMAIFVLSLLFVTGAGTAEASAYQGYNTIGSYQQYSYTHAQQGNYVYQKPVAQSAQISLGNPYYNYQSAPRAGGFFGSGSGWTTGLRAPVYTDVTPVHYSSFSRPVFGGHYDYNDHGYGGNYGYEYEETRIDVGFGWY